MSESGTFSIQAAEAFVMAKGDPWHRAFWRAAFGWGPAECLLFELEEFQQADGGWGGGLWVGDTGSGSTLASSIAALRLLSSINLGEDIFCIWERTAAYLAGCQVDGGWDQVNGVWPGVGTPLEDSIACRRAWFTAAIGAYLRVADANDDVSAAAGQVIAAWRVGDLATWPSRWMAICLGHGLDLDGADEMVTSCQEALGMTLNARTPMPWLSAELAWMHEALRHGGVPAGNPLRRRMWDGLAAGQAVDGGWDCGGERRARVEATLFAARELVSR